MEFKTKVGVSYPNKINVHGYDLAEDLRDEIPLADMSFFYTNKVNMLKKEGI